MSGGSIDWKSTAIEFAAADIAGSAVVAYMYGAPFTDVALSLSGGAGAALGYTLGNYLAPQISSKPSIQMAVAVAGAAAVPGVIGGAFDAELLVLAAGAAAGCYLAQWAITKSK